MADQRFTLELLHAADQEAGIPALVDAPNFSAVLNALKAQDLGNDGIEDNTLVLSSGDAIIPGLFFSASADVFGGGRSGRYFDSKTNWDFRPLPLVTTSLTWGPLSWLT